MHIKILGCSGGIGAGLRTTSLLIDSDILMDAGSGVGDLTMQELLAIDHIFITHTHLDHIAFIPFLVDTVIGIRTKPITLHATKEVLDILRTHIFNWKIWPDFNAIPNAQTPFMLYQAIKIGEPSTLASPLGQRTITALPVNHVVPAVGYHISNGKSSLVFSGDTTLCDALIKAINQIKSLKYLLIETAFSNTEHTLATLSKHLTPTMLMHVLEKINAQPEVFITHIKPGEGDAIFKEIMQEAAQHGISWPISLLQQGQTFTL